MAPAVDVQVVATPAALLADPPLCSAIDRLGVLSAEAQQLPRVITSTALLGAPAAVSERQKLLVARDRSSGDVLGFIKSGVKHLFYLDRQGHYSELDPLCVLDFYIFTDQQRRGIGLLLFKALLEADGGIQPAEIAYDRPSPLLFAFLAKHTALTEFFPQPNSFVVFDEYFSLHPDSSVAIATGKQK